MVAVWACARSVLAISNGLNSVFEIEETRNYIFRRLRSGVYVILLLLSLVLAMALLVFGNYLHDLLLDLVPFLQKFSSIVISLRTAGALFLLTLLLAAMYTFLPNKKQRFRSQLPGAAVAALSWSIFSYGISVYFEWRGSFPQHLWRAYNSGYDHAVAVFLHVAALFRAMLNVYFEENTPRA